MNLQHLGDALDFWKGGVFRSLDITDQLRVLPMLTDAQSWTPDQLALYATLLCLPGPGRILRCQVQFPENPRASYFEVPCGGGPCIFLDPDTGIGPGGGKHVTITDLDQVLSCNGVEMLVVYQHAHRTEGWLADLIATLKLNLKAPVFVFGLDCGAAGMIFIARKSDGRFGKARSDLDGLLGPIKSVMPARGQPSAYGRVVE